MNELIKDEDVFGISVSVLDTEAYAPVINRGVELGKAIITFDSDAPDSDRLAYVGTDNYEMGRELAKLLKQIKLDGGNVASSLDLDTISRNVFGVLKKDWRKMVAFGLKSKTRPRTDTRIQLSACKSCGRSHKSTQTPWVTLGGIVSVVGLPMFDEHTTHWINCVDSNPSVLTVIAGSLPVQLDLMQRSYVDALVGHALVGQLPYNMGYKVQIS